MTAEYAPTTIGLMFVPGELQAETLAAVEGVQRLVVRCATPRSQPTSYARHLLKLWDKPGDLILLEQDKVPPLGWFDELRRCSCSLCVYPYMSEGVMITEGFGVIKFKSTLKALYPHAIASALGIHGGSPRWPTYRQLDTRVHGWLRAHDVVRHVHEPLADHLHQQVFDYA